MSEPFTIYAIKWCLSKGIPELRAWEYPGNPHWVVVCPDQLEWSGLVLQAGEWFRDRASAVKAANQILVRAKRNASQRLEELDSVIFEEREPVL